LDYVDAAGFIPRRARRRERPGRIQVDADRAPDAQRRLIEPCTQLRIVTAVIADSHGGRD
jgi:hypothetical protein